MHPSENIAALIGSRICHDLISPIGAVSNGLELLTLSGAADGPEMSLVSDSAASATARIRLFRLAFGLASEGQTTRADEIVSIWQGVHADRRIDLVWTGPAELDRRVARLVMLACLCAETALPLGGRLRITQEPDAWQITATGPRIHVDDTLWPILTGAPAPAEIRPAHVQFLLLPHHLADSGQTARYTLGDAALVLRVQSKDTQPAGTH